MDKKLYEELITDWEELEAYRTLNGQPFDFGTGLITNESQESEDVYWKIQQQSIEHILDHLDSLDDEYNYKIIKHKRKRRKSRSKDIDNRKLKKIARISWFPVYYSEEKGRYIRSYISGRRKFAKWWTNRTIRHTNEFPLKGNGYRRVVNYWDIVY